MTCGWTSTTRLSMIGSTFSSSSTVTVTISSITPTDLAVGKNARLLKSCPGLLWTPPPKSWLVYCPPLFDAFLQLLGVNTSATSWPTSLRYLGSLSGTPFSFGGNFHVRTLLFYSSSWTFPRRNISTGPHTRPSTPSFTIVRLFPSKGFLLTVSFDPGNMLGTQISFPAWDSTAVAVIRATAILKTIGSTKRLQID